MPNLFELLSLLSEHKRRIEAASGGGWNAREEVADRKMGEQLDNYPFRLARTYLGNDPRLSENRVEFENRRLYDAMMRATNARLQGHFSYPGEVGPYAPISVDRVGEEELNRANRKFPAIRQRMNKEELDYPGWGP